MKKLLSILLLLTILFMVSCSNNEPISSTTTNTTATTAPKRDEPQTPINDNEIPDRIAPDPYTERTAYDFTYDGPIGTGVGINPGRVVQAHDPDAFTWNGSGYWYLEKNFNQAAVLDMLMDGIASLGGEGNWFESLDMIFAEFNQRVNGEAAPYTPGEKLQLKLTLIAMRKPRFTILLLPHSEVFYLYL